MTERLHLASDAIWGEWPVSTCHWARGGRATHSWFPGSSSRQLWQHRGSRAAPGEMLSAAAERLPPLSVTPVVSSVLSAVIVLFLQRMGIFVRNSHVLHRNPVRDDVLFHLSRCIACFTPLSLDSSISETKQEFPAGVFRNSKEPHCPHLWFLLYNVSLCFLLYNVSSP